MAEQLRNLCAELYRLKDLTGATYAQIAAHPSVKIARSTVNDILIGKVKLLPARAVVVGLLDALYEFAQDSGHRLGLPDRAALLAHYDWLAAPRRASPVPPESASPALPIGSNLVVRVDAARIEVLTAGEGAVLAGQSHAGIGSRLILMLNELDRQRRRTERIEDRPFVPSVGDHLPQPTAAWYKPIGPEIGARFLSGPVGVVLRTVLNSRRNARIALVATDSDLAALPWESAVVPGMTGPWCRQDGVQFYRHVGAIGPGQDEPAVPGPLKIVISIANPPSRLRLSGFHEQGLAAVDESVKAARRERLTVIDEPAWGDPAALRDTLASGRYHVLYLTCPVNRTGLLFETADGREQSVAPDQLVDDVFGAAPPVPFVILRTFAIEPRTQVWPVIHDFVDRLCAVGTRGVLVIPASMTPREVVRFTSAMFTHTARYPSRTILEVASHARRHEREEPYGEPRLFLTLAGVDRVSVDPDRKDSPHRRETALGGLPARAVGDFVGRRAELTTILGTFQGPGTGIVVTGIGGIGKSTLAAQALRILGPDRTGIVVIGQGITSVETILATLIQRLRSWGVSRPTDNGVLDHLLEHLGNARLGWSERIGLVADHILPKSPVTLLLDGFEENLDSAGQLSVTELGEFLTAWVRLHDAARLLVTSRREVALPAPARPWVTTLRLGPLTMAEARRLVWRLPALDALAPDDLRSVVATVGGHPRALEYFDALLRGGEARFLDVQARLRDVLLDRLALADPGSWMAGDFADADHVLAETIALISGDVLLTTLLEQLGAESTPRELLVRASVFRQPVKESGLRSLVSEIDAESYDRARFRLVDLGLLAHVSAAPDGSRSDHWIVHRWTAGALENLADAATLCDAHGQAAEYWLSVVNCSDVPDSSEATTAMVMAQLEAAHHLLAAGRGLDAAWAIDFACGQLDVRGGFSWIMQICRDAAAQLNGSGAAEAIVLSRQGCSAARLAIYRESADCLDQALAIRRQRNVAEGLVANLANIATLSQLYGDYPNALSRYREALMAFGPGDDNTALAAVNYNLGNLARRRGDLDAAHRCYDRGLRISELQSLRSQDRRPGGSGDTSPDLSSFRNDTMADLGSPGFAPLAIDADAPASELPRWDLNRAELATSGYGRPLHNLILRHRGEYPAIEQRRLDKPYDAPVRAISVASGHCNLGVVAQTKGDYDVAAEHHRAAHQIFAEMHDQGRLPIVLHNQALLAQLSGDLVTARDRYEQALTLFSEINDLAGFTGYHNLGGIAYAEHDLNLAASLYEQADAAYIKLHDPIGRAGIAANLGMTYADRGDHSAADIHYRRAWQVFAQAGDALSCAAVASNIGRLFASTRMPADGVPWSLRGLLTRCRYRLAEAAVDADALAAQRAAIGRREFGRLLRIWLADSVASEVDALVAERGI